MIFPMFFPCFSHGKIDPTQGDPGAPRCLQAALGSGSVDVCAALLLHGASAAEALADVTGTAPEVRRLLELFQGRAPEAGDGWRWMEIQVL